LSLLERATFSSDSHVFYSDNATPLSFYIFVKAEFKILIVFSNFNRIAIIVDGELEGCHYKLGIKTRMISYLAKIALCSARCGWTMCFK
jgi:hypothetical protein